MFIVNKLFNSKKWSIGKQGALSLDFVVNYRLFPVKGTHLYRDKFSCNRYQWIYFYIERRQDDMV